MLDQSLATSPRRPLGLGLGHFRKIAAGGFGDGRNSYAYGYAWYDDHLYIGTNRDLLVLARTRFRFEIPTAVWPVEMPQQYDPAEAGGEIWRYSPASDSWQRVYKSPLTTGVEGRTVPVATGFRNMLVFQGQSDPRPALYTIPSCGTFGAGPVMLRSTDGTHFEQISEPGLGLGDQNITAFRSLVAFKGRLFMTPAGSRGGDPNVSYHANILCSDDPVRGNWQITNESGFGDPKNYGVYDMCAAGDWLYAGTMNIRGGCQLWKTDAEGDPPYRWQKVFDSGAERGGYFNQGVVSITAFNGDVYVGTGIQNGGFDRVNNIGPGASEIIRVRPDDSWDLVVGEPRMTSQGLKSPTSGFGPGFDNPFAGYMWRMCEHEGSLYVGTFDSSPMFPYAKFTDHDRKILDRGLIEGFMRWRGGCELWRTADGDRWVPVTRNGFGNPFNWGIRTLLSTPRGLFVGTANPFGPRVAVKGAAGWHYEDNPRGGIDVWHGSFDHRPGEEDGPLDASPVSPLPAVGIQPTPDEAALELPPVSRFDLQSQSNPSSSGELDLLDEILDETIPLPSVTHRALDVERRARIPKHADPHGRLSIEENDLATPSDDPQVDIAEYFQGTSMRCVGYWRDELFTPQQACRTLVDELIELWRQSFDEERPAPAKPRVLAIGIGAPEIAGQVRRRLPRANVTPHDPHDALIPAGRKRFGRSPISPSALRHHLPAESFDLVVWIEGPSGSFGPRTSALSEVAGVLRTGGAMVAADLLGIDVDEAAEPRRRELNLWTPAEAYRRDCEAAGLGEVRLIDATHHGWFRFCRHSREYFTLRLLLHHLDRERFSAVMAGLPGGESIVESYQLVYAAKLPVSSSRPDGSTALGCES